MSYWKLYRQKISENGRKLEIFLAGRILHQQMVAPWETFAVPLYTSMDMYPPSNRCSRGYFNPLDPQQS